MTAKIEVRDGILTVTLGDGSVWKKPVPPGTTPEQATSEFMEAIVKAYGGNLKNIEVEKIEGGENG